MSKGTGTTMGTANAMKAKSNSYRHGPSNKNVVTSGRRAAAPTSGGRTKPIKGSDRGGV